MSVIQTAVDVVDGNHLETPTWVTSFAGLPRTVNVRRCRWLSRIPLGRLAWRIDSVTR